MKGIFSTKARHKFIYIFIWAFFLSGQTEEEQINIIRYKRNMQFLEFFKEKYYNPANEKIDKLKNDFKKAQAELIIAKTKKQKRKYKKLAESLRKKFEISARFIRYYEFSKKKYIAEFKGKNAERARFHQKAYLARLEYEELSGKKFAHILGEYNKSKYKLFKGNLPSETKDR